MADHRTYTLVRLPSHCCKWPVTERRSVVGHFLFCGRAQHPGSVYCKEHHDTAYSTRAAVVRVPLGQVRA